MEILHLQRVGGKRVEPVQVFSRLSSAVEREGGNLALDARTGEYFVSAASTDILKRVRMVIAGEAETTNLIGSLAPHSGGQANGAPSADEHLPLQKAGA